MRPEQILRLSDFWATRIILAAVELDLFPHLHEPISAETLADRRELNPEATARLLSALVALDILAPYGDQFVIREELKEALSDEPASIIPRLKQRARLWKTWSALPEVVRTGKDYYELYDPEGREAENERPASRPVALNNSRMAKEVVAKLNLEGVSRILDVGGAPGAYAYEFCEALVQVEVTILDMKDECEVARQALEQTPYKDRVKVIEGDALEIDDKEVIGEDNNGRFDIVFMSNLIHSMTREQVSKLMKRCLKWVKPGGRIIVKDFMLDEGRSSPPRGAIFAVNLLVSTPGGNCYTWTEVDDWLKNAQYETGKSHVRQSIRISLSDNASGMIVAEIR